MNPVNLAISLALLIAGMGIPIMAGLNAGLGTRIGNSLAAVFILSVVASLSSFALLTISGHPDWKRLSLADPTHLMAGMLFVFYLGAITYGAPRIGLGNAILLVLFGQILCATAIDHFALLGSIAQEITLKRTAGLILMGAGVILARG